MKLRRPLTTTTLGALMLSAAALVIFTQQALGTVRRDDWDDATVRVDSVCIYPLPDGGAAARIQAKALLLDGGVGREKPLYGELSGQGRTEGLQVLSRAQTLWVGAQQ